MDDSVSDTPKGSFPKTAHLLKHSDFQRVYQQGRRHFSGNMTVFYLRSPNRSCSRAERGRGSRQLRARTEGRCAHRIHRLQSAGRIGGAQPDAETHTGSGPAPSADAAGMSDAVDVVINPKKSLLAAEFPQISQEIERAFRVIRQNCELRKLRSSDGKDGKHGRHGRDEKAHADVACGL